jgi:hypothetical protein
MFVAVLALILLIQIVNTRSDMGSDAPAKNRKQKAKADAKRTKNKV